MIRFEKHLTESLSYLNATIQLNVIAYTTLGEAKGVSTTFIKWEIHDYYGNALNKGLLTEKEKQKLMVEPFDKLMKGTYSSHKATVTDYLRQHVAKTVHWDIDFAPVELT